MYTITLPQAVKDMHSATVARWFKGPGDPVQKGEALVEMDTERARVEVRADRDGYVRELLVPEGKTVVVGEPIARISASGEAAAASSVGSEARGAPAKADNEKPSQGPKGTAVPVLMPQVGNTMEEGTIIRWCVKEGDRINKADVIFEVETDKAAVEVEATDSGRLARIVASQGDTIEVLKPVAYLADDDADVDAYVVAHGAEADSPEQQPAREVPADGEGPPGPSAAGAPAVTTGVGRVKASPAARKAAAERGIDLAALGGGSGPGGRIVLSDIPAEAPAAGSTVAQGRGVRHPMSPMRKAIARSLLASKQNIPHFYIELTVDAEAMMDFYRRQKATYPCTINDVVVLACAKVISEFPPLRSRIDGEEIVEFPAANIGIAVGTDSGLVVPVLVGADQMTLKQVAARSRQIVEAARGGKLSGMGKGVFTITNMGMFGIERFSAIINPPEAAILAVGAVRETAVVSDGAIQPGRVMTMTLSCDHRVVDGLIAARFLSRLKELLETPDMLAQS